jgi:hypothetical protein
MKLRLKYPGKMIQKRNGTPSTAFLTTILMSKSKKKYCKYEYFKKSLDKQRCCYSKSKPKGSAQPLYAKQDSGI